LASQEVVSSILEQLQFRSCAAWTRQELSSVALNFQVMPESNDDHLVVMGLDFFNFHAGWRIFKHPLNLPSKRGEAIRD
jgi:hypothetical protein